MEVVRYYHEADSDIFNGEGPTPPGGWLIALDSLLIRALKGFKSILLTNRERNSSLIVNELDHAKKKCDPPRPCQWLHHRIGRPLLSYWVERQCRP